MKKLILIVTMAMLAFTISAQVIDYWQINNKSWRDINSLYYDIYVFLPANNGGQVITAYRNNYRTGICEYEIYVNNNYNTVLVYNGTKYTAHCVITNVYYNGGILVGFDTIDQYNVRMYFRLL